VGGVIASTTQNRGNPPPPPPASPPPGSGGTQQPQQPGQRTGASNPPTTARTPTPAGGTGAAGPGGLRIKFVTGVSCSAADRYTRGLGGVTVSIAGRSVVTDRGGVGRTTVAPGSHAVAVSYGGGGRLSLPSGDLPISSASVVSITVSPTAGTAPLVKYPPGASLVFKPTSNPSSASEYEVGIRLQSPQACGAGDPTLP
jgi:hypothetical protein